MKHQLTPAQRRSLQEADREGRAFVTLVDGRIAIILPKQPTDNAAAATIARIAAVLEAVLDPHD